MSNKLKIRDLKTLVRVALLMSFPALAVPAHADSKPEGCHIGEIMDQDGDLQIQMESEWISMYLMPANQSEIVRFVFRPSGNDIEAEGNPKFSDGGGGLLQDNFWEQDWRFSEFRNKFYDYQIVKNTPEEVSVVFQTKSKGFVKSMDSGVISKLLSDITIRRTVTLKKGAPYFLFDLELINDGTCAKMPQMWVHNSCLIDLERGDQVHRPSARGIRRIGGIGRPIIDDDRQPWEEDYVYDFNDGWSAKISASRKEGIVYLMDYDYLQFLYNCGTGTEEWVADNLLIPVGKSWKGRIYILPVMGLSKVDQANPYFILEIDPRREEGHLNITYRVTGSYDEVKRVTFNTELESGHLQTVQKRKLDPVSVEGLGVAPVAGTVTVDNPPADPLLLNIKAYIESPDGKMITKEFQYFHIGDYKFADNIRQDMHTPVVRLARPIQKPFIPTPAPDQKVNRTDWSVFAVLGNHSTHLRLLKALEGMGAKTEVGYTAGWSFNTGGLTDFPYDYNRLFNYRTVLLANCEFNVIRWLGASMLSEYLKRGGGLVLTGGESAFRFEFADPANDLNNYDPIETKANNIKKGTLRLADPVKDHPIFSGIDLGDLPYAYYYHDVQTKPGLPCKVLLKVGDKPFVVELTRGDQRTIAVLCTPFGDEAENPGKTPYWKWNQWEKLFANIVKYTGHGL